MFYRLFSLFLFSCLCVFQGVYAQKALDTIQTDLGKVVLYSNKSWSFLQVSNFDGVMNPRIDSFMRQQDPSFSHPWNNDVCFVSRNDLSKLKDTLWLKENEDYDAQFFMPRNGVVTSRYGVRHGGKHYGIDIDLETGDTVYAAWTGKVRYAKYNDGGYGNLVIIRHPNGLETLYAHLSKHLVYPDQDIVAGEPIGLGGNTGHSFGSHLHFETRFYDVPMNPEILIDFDKKQVKSEELFLLSSFFAPGANTNALNQETEGTVVQTPVVIRTPQVKYYKVRPGDTLTKIADRNATTVSKLCQLNGIKPTSVLQVGRSLRIK